MPQAGTWLQWAHKYEHGTVYSNRIGPTWIEMTRELVSGEKVEILIGVIAVVEVK